MVWIAAAIIIVFLLWRYPKFTLMGVAGLAAIAVIAGIGLFLYDEKEDRARAAEKSNILVSASIANEHCVDPNYPLWISAYNRNDFSIDAVSVEVEATQPGHSKVLYHNYFEQDRILKHAEGYAACWSIASYQVENGRISGFLPKDLTWTAQVSYITKTVND